MWDLSRIKRLEGTWMPPKIGDIRWRVLALLGCYLILGMTVLGFSRKPFQIVLLIATGAFLDLTLNVLIKKKKVFPLSAMISCCSLAILLNWSFDFINLFLPVFICIASKYIFTLNGKHFFNPSLFAICMCILIGGEYVTLAPSYQWYGTAESAWFMMYFVATAALLFFVFKINRKWLIISFLITFIAQSILRGIIMEHVIPFETLFIGSLTSPAFYLFTFYMITDPGTSPDGKWDQIFVGISIALLDLLFHLKFSLYTFFFAGLAVAAVRYFYFAGKQLLNGSFHWQFTFPKFIYLLIFAVPVFLGFTMGKHSSITDKLDLTFIPIKKERSGLKGSRGEILEQVDDRVQHVAKWVLSVGDAGAVADVDLDGLPDLFLTQILKSEEDRGKLYLNKGNFEFEKIAIPALEPFLHSPKTSGLPGFAYFADFDNDGDKDLFVGFGFGHSKLLYNQIIPKDTLLFELAKVPFLDQEHTVCLSANSLDFNNDGKLDMLITNTLCQYLPDYDRKVPLNIFDLPQPEFEGDRRMFHFMHESWHNANNGGLNYMLLNTGDENLFAQMPMKASNLIETRWSLATATLDMNNDGYTDIFIANDFGRDDWYLNDQGKRFIRQQGEVYGDLGLDTYKGMNATAGDINRSGKEDVYVSNVHHAMQAEGSMLWLNRTKTNAQKIDFFESAHQHNVLNTNRFGWGAGMADLDLNGWVDIIQANGMVDDIWDKKWDKPQDFWYYQAQIARTGPEIHSYADKWADIRGCYIYPNEKDRVSLNYNGKFFFDATDVVGIQHEKNTRGVITADFDNDGDTDLLFTHQFGDPFLYENKLAQKQWLGIVLEGNGTTTNRDGVGTKVWLSYEQNGEIQEQYKEMRLCNGFMAMGDTRMVFGFGLETIKNVSLKIQWHNGLTETLKVDNWNTYLHLKQKG